MLNPNWNMDDQMNAAKQFLKQYMSNVPPQVQPIIAGAVIIIGFGLLVLLMPRQPMTNSTPNVPTAFVQSEAPALVPTAPAQAQPIATVQPIPTVPAAVSSGDQTGRGLTGGFAVATPTIVPTDPPAATTEPVREAPVEIVQEVLVTTNDGRAIVTTDSNSNVTSTGAGACNIAKGARRCGK